MIWKDLGSDWGFNRKKNCPRSPRRWQAVAYPVILKHFATATPLRAMIRAITGSGKSVLMSHVAASCVLEPDEVVVITTKTIKLVEQLAETFREHLDPVEFMGGESKVGTFYTKSKDIHTPIIIACTPSAPDLARTLAANDKRCALWIADEAHNTSTPTMFEAYENLRPKLVCGWSATPWRAKETESLSLFDKLIVDYDIKEARADGDVIVPWRIVPWEGGETDLDSACLELTELAIGPGMFNAVSISDAEVFAQKLNHHGIKAETVHNKIKEDEISRRIKMLEAGDLHAIVHVNMLQEGIDLPWLCWLCMRRPVGSRTRFAQEIGRILRYCMDLIWGTVRKTEGVIYDPHNLFASMSLDYDAVLGGDYTLDVDLDDEKDESKLRERILEQSVFDMMAHLTRVKAGKEPLSLTPLASYLTEVITAYDVCGLLDERKISNRSWRSMGSSAKQQSSVMNLKWVLGKKCVPPVHRKAMGLMTELGKDITRGMASDMMSVMMSLADKKQWPDFKELDRSAESSMKRHEARKSAPRPQMNHTAVTPRKAPLPQKTPQQLKKAAKEAEKNRPSLFDPQ